MKFELLKVGTDAEVFLRRGGTNRPHPVIGLLGGTKTEPRPLPELGAGFFIQEDNVMPEFNIPAAADEASFVRDIGVMHGWLTQTMADKGFTIDIAPSMIFTKSQLAHPQAQEVGCEPDFNVWTRSINTSPKQNKAMETMRTAAAHIHVSYLVDGHVPEDMVQREPIVKALDLTIGLPSVLLDADKKRRTLYGKAGAFRPKDYGIEHRVASNFWIATEALRRWAWRGVVEAITKANDKSYMAAVEKNYRDTIIHCINTCDVDRTKNLLAKFGLSHRLIAE